MQRHKGFSLLEILVAFVIMAVALTIVLRIFGSGVNNAVISEEYTIAVQIAESLLARTGVDTPLEIGDISGNEAGKYFWTISTSLREQNSVTNNQTQNTQQNPAQNGQVTSLFAIIVRVTWDDESSSQRVVELSSLKTL
jgi:general secretion pathway protein I